MEANTAIAQPPDVATEDKLPKLQLTNVFISYSRRNGRFVSRLVRWLNENNVQVWMDAKNIRIGKNWREQIDEGIRQSDQFLLVASRASRKSDDVLNELALAKDAGKPIVQIQYRKCKPFYDTVTAQYVDCSLCEEDGFRKLFYLEPLKKPWWRRVLIFLKKYRLHFYIMATILFAALLAIYGWPSKTSVEITPRDRYSIALSVQNGGGQFATVVDGHFKLDFGKLPIEPQDLVLCDRKQGMRVWGHRNATLCLMTEDKLTPRESSPDCYFNEGQIKELLSHDQYIRVVGSIKESDGHFYPRATRAMAARPFEEFILEAFPDEVPCRTIR